jgi:hypothetical protein
MISPTNCGQVDLTSLFFIQSERYQLAGERSVHEGGFSQEAVRHTCLAARFTVAGGDQSRDGRTLTVF